MSCAPACPRCAPARTACASRFRPSTPSWPTARSTFNSPTASRTSSPTCAPRPPPPPFPNVSASCGCSSKTSSSAPTRSPSGIASRSVTARPTAAPRPTRRTADPDIANCVGGVGSPLLANVYLHRLDRARSTREHGVLVRFADDAVVMCASREQAQAALARLTALLADLGLEPKAAKTRIVHLTDGGEGFDFLGFHHRLVRGRTPKSAHLTFLARWPSRRATQRARDRIREITDRSRLLVPVEDLVQEINLFLRGWAGYFRYGNSARVLGQIRKYALRRIALLLSKRGKRRRSWGWGITQVLLSPDHLGLIRLDGAVVPPRPFRDWRGKAERRR